MYVVQFLFRFLFQLFQWPRLMRTTILNDYTSSLRESKMILGFQNLTNGRNKLSKQNYNKNMDLRVAEVALKASQSILYDATTSLIAS